MKIWSAPVIEAENEVEPKPKLRRKPGRKAGEAYGLGIPAGKGRHQLTVSFETLTVKRLNHRAERSGVPRATVIVIALERLFASDDPLLGKSADDELG